MDSHQLWKHTILIYDIDRILLWSVFLISILFLVLTKRFFSKLLNNQENALLLNKKNTLQDLLQKHSTSKCNFLFLVSINVLSDKILVGLYASLE